jgi:rRNA maturation protein Nop10
MAGRCPGQDGRQLTVSLHICPTCGSEVEMFSDEIRVKCRTCGSYVQKDSVPSCVEWCSQARACLGEERWRALMGTRGADDTGADDATPDGGAADGGADAAAGEEVGDA